jgi:hypothetical protein
MRPLGADGVKYITIYGIRQDYALESCHTGLSRVVRVAQSFNWFQSLKWYCLP